MGQKFFIFITNKGDENKRNFFEYLNDIKHRVEFVSFKGNNGDVIKQVIFFQIDVYIGIGNIKVPVKILCVPSENSTPVVGLDVISQCIWTSYMEQGIYKVRFDMLKYGQISFRFKAFDRGLCLISDRRYANDVYYHSSEISSEFDLMHIKSYKTIRTLYLAEINFYDFIVEFDVNELIYFLTENGDYYVQDLSPVFNNMFYKVDGIYFIFENKTYIVLREDGRFLEQCELIKSQELDDYQFIIGNVIFDREELIAI